MKKDSKSLTWTQSNKYETATLTISIPPASFSKETVYVVTIAHEVQGELRLSSVNIPIEYLWDFVINSFASLPIDKENYGKTRRIKAARRALLYEDTL